MLDGFNIDEAIFRAAVARAKARIDQGEQPPVVSLPTSKAAFPKMLALDFNKWVDLGSAHYAKPKGERFKPVLAAVRTAIAAGRLVVPVLPANVNEAMQPSDEGLRRRVASFMLDLSGNHSFVANRVVLDAELRRAIEATHGAKVDSGIARNRMIRRGMSAAIVGKEPTIATGDAPIDAIANEAMLDPEVVADMIVQCFDRASRDAMRSKEAATADRATVIRDQLSAMTFNARQHAELTNLLTGGGSLATALRAVANERSDGSAFYRWLQRGENVLVFAAAVPSVDVMATLMMTRDRNLDDGPDKNDSMDFAFLKLAIPYANIVVTENSWAHLAVHTKLAEKYETKVIADVAELPDVLAAEGSP